ncbi:MAG: DUF502 domain-containing protein [bacterium]|nr:DUF502 domain-containing protein [bacterium]
MKRIRAYFYAGIILVLPLGLLLFILSCLVKIFKNISSAIGLKTVIFSLVAKLPLPSFLLATGEWLEWLLIAVSIAAILIFLGWFSSKIGKRIIEFLERAIKKIPLIGSLYFTFRETAKLTLKEKKAFREVVKVQVIEGIQSIGFVVQRKDTKVVVFIPFVPNPLTGITIIVDSSLVIPTGLSVEEGMRWMISFGASPDLLS